MRHHKVYMVSLGCPKNRVDSEMTLGALRSAGLQPVENEREADLLLVNTCGFVADAKEESIDTILDLAAIKKEGKKTTLAVMGCLSERYREELKERIPEIDALFGVAELPSIVKKLAPHPHEIDPTDPDRLVTTAPHWAYLKIADGCSNKCSFCIIPTIRGPFVSRPQEEIIAEAEKLAATGIRELILVAQDSTLYGADLKMKEGLDRLLSELEKVEGIVWIRLMYLYPALISDRLLDHMAASEKIVPYFDMPLQHGSDQVLAAMVRPETNASIRALIKKIRTKMPHAAIRTTFIVGFPGETKTDFNTLYALVQWARFDHMGVFIYSPEEGTTAFHLTDAVAEEVATERRDRLMTLQQSVSADKLAARVGEEAEVMIDIFDAEEMILPGRLNIQAPEIDGSVILDRVEGAPGERVMVRIVGATDYDLVAEGRER